MNMDKKKYTKRQLLTINALLKKCFGKSPISCDGVLIVEAVNYNELVEYIRDIAQ